MALGDLLRFVVVALAALSTGAMVTVIRLHWRAWRSAPSASGLVPLHVWLIALAHTFFVVGTGIGIAVQIGDGPASWRVALYIVGNVLTLAALTVIGVYQRRRVQPPTVISCTVETRT